MKKKYTEIKPLDILDTITPKMVINKDEYEELLEYKFRYLELKEIVDKWISLSKKGE